MINPLKFFQKLHEDNHGQPDDFVMNSPRGVESHEVESIMILADGIISHHIQEGAMSPLNGSLVADMSFKNSIAKQRHADGIKYLRMAKEALAERDMLVGANTMGDQKEATIAFYVKCLREILVNSGYSSKELFAIGFLPDSVTKKGQIQVTEAKSKAEPLL